MTTPMKSLFAAAFLPAALMLAACGGKEEEVIVRVADLATVRTIPQGELVGYVQEVERAESTAHVWLGIPFAQAPVGNLRWRAARAPEGWAGQREALEHSDWCVQYTNAFDAGFGYPEGELHGSEDCLYLNVYAPAFEADGVPAGDAALPVMVWIHGGGNVWGRASQYDGSALAARENVIVVMLQYRLGPLGWMAHPALRETAELPIDRTSNFGTFDMIAALLWVQESIAAFGGDPARVTIFGESAGGHDVASLLVAPQASGLFHRAIIQSGSTRFVPLAMAEGTVPAPPGRTFMSTAEGLGSIVNFIAAPTPEEQASAFRSVDVETLYAAYHDSDGTGDLTIDPARVIADGVVLPEGGILAAMEAGAFHRVPVMAGTNRDETKLFNVLDERFTNSFLRVFIWPKNARLYDVIAEYQSRMWAVRGVDEIARAMSSNRFGNIYAYRFDWDEEGSFITTNFATLLGAAHSWEIPFIFDRWQLAGRLDPVLWNERNAEGRLALSDAMMGYWAEFARAGNPGTGDGDDPRWSLWGDGTRIVLDTDAGGGIRMAAGQLTQTAVYARILDDDRLRSDEERCLVYRATVAWWPATAQQGFMDGACEG